MPNVSWCHADCGSSRSCPAAERTRLPSVIRAFPLLAALRCSPMQANVCAPGAAHPCTDSWSALCTVVQPMAAHYPWRSTRVLGLAWARGSISWALGMLTRRATSGGIWSAPRTNSWTKRLVIAVNQPGRISRQESRCTSFRRRTAGLPGACQQAGAGLMQVTGRMLTCRSEWEGPVSCGKHTTTSRNRQEKGALTLVCINIVAGLPNGTRLPPPTQNQSCLKQLELTIRGWGMETQRAKSCTAGCIAGMPTW